jgi:hypothetical protein
VKGRIKYGGKPPILDIIRKDPYGPIATSINTISREETKLVLNTERKEESNGNE